VTNVVNQVCKVAIPGLIWGKMSEYVFDVLTRKIDKNSDKALLAGVPDNGGCALIRNLRKPGALSDTAGQVMEAERKMIVCGKLGDFEKVCAEVVEHLGDWNVHVRHAHVHDAEWSDEKKKKWVLDVFTSVIPRVRHHV